MTSTTDLLDGRYRLVRLLGQGGMSDVYEAIDERSDTAVAIKFVRSADPELARRFAQEVRALGRVEHPGLVRLIGTGLADDHAYLVMELVQGSTLAEALRHGPLGPERTAYLGASLAGALAYVHGRGVVHRDVKPSNILLHADGRAQLGDFGVARLLDASALTMAGTTLGTAAYMAPEQLEDHQVGAGADIWSLGMVLLECLTGHRVYEGSTAQVVAKRMAGPVPLPGDLPVTWKLLLSGMLDHRPEQRLEGTDIAALLVTSPFRAAWSPSPNPDATPAPSTGVLNLTALVPGTSTTALLGPGTAPPTAPATAPAPTRVALSESPARPRRHRRWWLAVLGAPLAIALVVALLAAFPSSPASNLGHLTSATQPPATSTTTSAPTTTTTTLAAIPAALAVLNRDIASDQSNGTLDPAAAQSITSQAQQAVLDAAASQPDQAASHLQRAGVTIDTGQLDGSVDPGAASMLQSDLSALATALGVGSGGATGTTGATDTTTTSGAGPGGGNGHGPGQGQGD
jgi:serine/threonine protein kinase